MSFQGCLGHLSFSFLNFLFNISCAYFCIAVFIFVFIIGNIVSVGHLSFDTYDFFFLHIKAFNLYILVHFLGVQVNFNILLERVHD